MESPLRASQTTPQKRSRLGFFWTVAVLFLSALGATGAAELKLAWDPVPGAAGYFVDYGTDPSNLSTRFDAGSAAEATLQGLANCTNWHFTVRAYDSQRQAAEASNPIYGWPRPEISTPVRARQGESLMLDVVGANFSAGAGLTIDNPNVLLQNVVRIDCQWIQATVSVAPAGPGARPAEVGAFQLRAVNPNGLYNRIGGAFSVEVDPSRFDLDRSHTSTEDRIDGADLSRMAFNWGGCDDVSLSTCDSGDAARYLPDLDLDGNGWIDGEDLSYIVMQRWGRCWSPQTGDWTDNPIVHPTAGVLCPTVAP